MLDKAIVEGSHSVQQIVHLNESDDQITRPGLTSEKQPLDHEDSEILLNVANEISGDEKGIQEMRPVKATRRMNPHQPNKPLSAKLHQSTRDKNKPEASHERKRSSSTNMRGTRGGRKNQRERSS